MGLMDAFNFLVPSHLRPQATDASIHAFNQGLFSFLPFAQIVSDQASLKSFFGHEGNETPSASGPCTLLHYDGSMVKAFRFSPIYHDAMSDDSIMMLERTLKGFCNLLELDESVQIISNRYPAGDVLKKHLRMQISEAPVDDAMADSRREHWDRRINNGYTFSTECIFWIRKKFKRIKSLKNLFNGLDLTRASMTKEMKEAVEEMNLQQADFIRRCHDLSMVLGAASSIRELSGQDMFGQLWGAAQGMPASLAPKLDLRAELHPQFGAIDVVRRSGSLSVNGLSSRHIEILSMVKWGESSRFGCIAPLMGRLYPYRISMTMKPRASEKVIQSLEDDMAKYHSMSATELNPGHDMKLREHYQALAKLKGEQELVLNLETYAIVEAKRWNLLDQYAEDISKQVQRCGLGGMKREEVGKFVCFLNAFPGVCPSGTDKTASRDINVFSSNCADFMPVLGCPASADKPLFLFEGPYSTLFGYNPFDPPAKPTWPHTLIFGATGKGKSFTTTLLILSAMSANPKVYIVDKGGSYSRLTRLRGGAYIDISVDNVAKTNFNPLEGKSIFDVKFDDEDESSSESTKGAFLNGKCHIIEEMIRDNEEPLKSDERTIVRSLIETVYTLMRNPDYGDQEPTLSLLYQIAADPESFPQFEPEHKDEMAKIQASISRRLKRWARADSRTGVSEFAAQLLDNNKSSVSLDNDFVCFNLQHVGDTPGLLNVMFVVISNLIMSNCLVDRGRKKLIIFDEVWSLLSSESGAKFLSELYRTMRKFNAIVFSISQSVEDFLLDEKVAAALLTNTSQYIILRQPDGKLDMVQDVLKINDSTKRIIGTLEQKRGVYSEIMLYVDGEQEKFSSRIRIMPSPVEYWVATTDGKMDLPEIERYMKEGYSEEDAILLLARELPFGVEGTKAARVA